MTGSAKQPTRATAWLWLDAARTTALVQSFEPLAGAEYKSCSLEVSTTGWSIASWIFTRQ